MEKEVFKKVPLPVYDEEYQISNYGRLWSNREKRFMSFSKMESGHLQTVLSLNNIQKSVRCHVLVAKAFIPNPKNKTVVHHIDGNPENNYFENLMWVTPTEHALIHSQNFLKGSEINSKPVYKYSLDGEFISEYKSVAEAARQLNVRQGNISECCLGRYKTIYGYQWRYEKCDRIPSIETIEKRRWKNRAKTVIQYTLNGEFVAEYQSATEAGEKTGINSSNIRSCCRGEMKKSHGFIWKYKET